MNKKEVVKGFSIIFGITCLMIGLNHIYEFMRYLLIGCTGMERQLADVLMMIALIATIITICWGWAK